MFFWKVVNDVGRGSRPMTAFERELYEKAHREDDRFRLEAIQRKFEKWHYETMIVDGKLYIKSFWGWKELGKHRYKDGP